MDDPYEPPTSPGGSEPPSVRSGWTPLKILGMVAALVGMVGFGLCGVIGIALRDPGTMKLGVLGLVIAGCFLWGIIVIMRNARL